MTSVNNSAESNGVAEHGSVEKEDRATSVLVDSDQKTDSGSSAVVPPLKGVAKARRYATDPLLITD